MARASGVEGSIPCEGLRFSWLGSFQKLQTINLPFGAITTSHTLSLAFLQTEPSSGDFHSRTCFPVAISTARRLPFLLLMSSSFPSVENCTRERRCNFSNCLMLLPVSTSKTLTQQSSGNSYPAT